MQAKAGMKLGVNNDVNLGTKKAALHLMDGGGGGGGIKNKPSPTAIPQTQPTRRPWLRNHRGQMIYKLQKKKLFQKNHQSMFQKKRHSMK